MWPKPPQKASLWARVLGSGSMLGWVIAAAAVIVRGSMQCPTPEAIAARVEAMTAPDETRNAPDELDIEQRGARLRVSLKRADGWLIGRREVQKSDNCAETADVIAVVVASFRTNAAGKLPEDEPAAVA